MEIQRVINRLELKFSMDFYQFPQNSLWIFVNFPKNLYFCIKKI